MEQVSWVRGQPSSSSMEEILSEAKDHIWKSAKKPLHNVSYIMTHLAIIRVVTFCLETKLFIQSTRAETSHE
jgi:hypothetical protein